MFRQILVDPRDRCFQRILWRNSPDDELNIYELATVTFGVTCAPFLALRVLEQLVVDEGMRFPSGANVLRQGLYVDDCLFGADSIDLTRSIRRELVQLLNAGGFKLRKWASNASELLSDIDPSNHGLAWDKPLRDGAGIKILGVYWDPSSDAYLFKVNLEQPIGLTKRFLLSIISRFYDPLGWVSPVIITAKILNQNLWRLKHDWDSRLPDEICDRWCEFHGTLQRLSDIKIPRWTGQNADTESCIIVGFCDASSAAYGAVIYLRVESKSEPPRISILASKTKVAPIKVLSVPRLELCAALLLARLVSSFRSNVQFACTPIHCRTDATIVLHWLNSDPTRWKTFVANRVSEIQQLLPDTRWGHVSTQENPADLASRGVSAAVLAQSKLWFEGPCWLRDPIDLWRNDYVNSTTSYSCELSEERSNVVSCIGHSNDTFEQLGSRISTWDKLLRVTSYLLSWKRRTSTSKTPAIDIDASDIEAASIVWFRYLQSVLFHDEFCQLQSGNTVAPSSPLNPFLDKVEIIRVGGRIKHAGLPFSATHPIALRAHPIVRMLVRRMHSRCLHGLQTLRQTIWLLQAKKIIRSVIFHCVTCAKIKSQLSVQMMGNLPAPRVQRPARPFAHSGVDYAGPYQVRLASGRGQMAHSSFIALFICFATKAIHLELVSDYSAKTFIAAFKRFTARRGIPSDMYSDQGTTFVGANTELVAAFNEAITNEEFRGHLAKNGTLWHFIPPAAPHFGGLWEAGVKSVKYHLNRILLDRTPTSEELITLLCEIEAALNSRPLGPLNEGVDDLKVLTPGHFIAGGPLNAVPEPSLLDLSGNRLLRWQHYRQLFERFWEAWSADYILSLQHRTKWRVKTEPIKEGQIVLMHLPGYPPTKWPLARVVKCHTGDDNLTRVVTLRTATSTLDRPISKIALLPIDLEGS